MLTSFYVNIHSQRFCQQLQGWYKIKNFSRLTQRLGYGYYGR